MRTMLTDANTQSMLPAGNTNSMVLTGFGDSVAALARMLKTIDEASKIDPAVAKANELQFEMIQLQHAAAQECAHAVNSLVNPPRAEGENQQVTEDRVKVLVDARTNSLVISAKAKDMGMVKNLIAALDIPAKK